MSPLNFTPNGIMNIRFANGSSIETYASEASMSSANAVNYSAAVRQEYSELKDDIHDLATASVNFSPKINLDDIYDAIKRYYSAEIKFDQPAITLPEHTSRKRETVPKISFEETMGFNT